MDTGTAVGCALHRIRWATTMARKPAQVLGVKPQGDPAEFDLGGAITRQIFYEVFVAVFYIVAAGRANRCTGRRIRCVDVSVALRVAPDGQRRRQRN